MSAPRFDPAAAKALIAEARKSHWVFGPWSRCMRCELTNSLESAISAIEGPEDGAGEIASVLAYIETLHEDEGTFPLDAEDKNYIRKACALIRRLATRAPSESAVTDEGVIRACQMSDEPECPGPDCMMCNGEACNKCGAGCWGPIRPNPPCEHDVIDRHEGVETAESTVDTPR